MAFDAAPPARAPTAEDKLIADAARFRERGTVVEAASENPVQGLINVLGTVLGFNFVVIVGLFLWFLCTSRTHDTKRSAARTEHNSPDQFWPACLSLPHRVRRAHRLIGHGTHTAPHAPRTHTHV